METISRMKLNLMVGNLYRDWILQMHISNAITTYLLSY